MSNLWTKDRISSAGDLTSGYHFKVDFNGVSFGFQTVSGIQVTRSFEPCEEGGVNDHKILLGKPQDDNPELTFTRGLLLRASSAITGAAKAAAALIPNNAGRKAAFFALNTLDPQELLEYGPALGTITVYSTTKRDKIIGLYSFLALGIKEWSLGDLDATSGSILIETFKVMHTGITRLPLSPPSGAYYLGNSAEASKVPWEPIDVDAVEKSKEEFNKARDEELAKNVISIRDKFQKMHDSAEKLKEKFEEERDVELEKSITAIREQFKEMYHKSEEAKRKFEEQIEKAKNAAEEKKNEISKNLARMLDRASNKYLAERQELSESMEKSIKAQKKILEQIRKHSKELANSTRMASRLAQDAADRLSLDLVSFKELQKEKIKDYKDKAEKAEISKFAAIKTMELARAMAKSSKEAAKELQSQKWQKMMQKNQDEIDKVREDFEKQRRIGLKKTEKAVDERMKREEEHRENVGKLEKAKEEFEAARDRETRKEIAKTQKEYELKTKEIEEAKKKFEEQRAEAIKTAQEMADEAAETAAEAENQADEIQNIIDAS